MKLKKLFMLIVAFVFVVSLGSCGKKNCNNESFKLWNDCDSLNVLTDYVEDVTNSKSKNYIPVKDRIATFDMDGTLCGELFPTYLEYLLCAYRVLDDDTCNPTDEMIEVAEQIREGAKTNTFPSDMPLKHAQTQAKAFSGMTIPEFDSYVKNFLKMNADGFSNLAYENSFYKPMLEVLAYLQENDFKTYIVSGSDRFICRSCACDICNIPENQIIGMDIKLEASNQNGEDGLNYVFDLENDKVIRTDQLLIKNLKMNKVSQIAQEIGKEPVLSFGNSSGDTSMHNYALSNPNYKAEAFMLIANDEVRDYGSEEKGDSLGEKWEKAGYNVISMRDDFKTIYGYDIVKTKFSWQ